MQGNTHHTMHNAIMDAVSTDIHIHQYHIGQHIQSLRINHRGIHIRISVNHKRKEQHNQIAHIHIIIEGVVKSISMMIVRMIAIGMRMVRVGSRHHHRIGHIVRGSSERKSDVTE